MNLDDLMKKAQDIQSKMQQAQNDLLNVRIVGESGGGLVKITFNGRHEAIETTIDDSVLNDKSMLEDLVTAAINDGCHKIEGQTKDQLSSLTSGLDLPSDFNMPFGNDDSKKDES